MKYKVFGCKVNKYYTDLWLKSDYLRDKTGIFVASCTVTDSAKKKWIKFVKSSISEIKTNDKIFISGCGAFDRGDKNKNFFEEFSELKIYEENIVLLPEKPFDYKKGKSLEDGNKEKVVEGLKPSFTNNSKISLNEIIKNKLSLAIKGKSLYTRKFVLIQSGCDSFCSFCMTVKKRGKHYYRSKEDILEEILDFEREDGKEVVLTGVNLSAWGLDSTNDIHNSKFAELLQYLLDNSDIERIRISSLGPEFIDEKVLKVFENSRISPHFHFSIQSGSSKVLKRMGRHYDSVYMRNLLGNIRKLKRQDSENISIGADLIVGFPGETSEDFEETLNLIKDFEITKLHAFPFSSHQMGDTVPAARFLDQIDEKIKKERLDKLIETGNEMRKEFVSRQFGKEFDLLLEGNPTEKVYKGWTENYIELTEKNSEIISGKIARGEILKARLIGFEDERLSGEI